MSNVLELCCMGKFKAGDKKNSDADFADRTNRLQDQPGFVLLKNCATPSVAWAAGVASTTGTEKS
jgi:hypothetical protein